MTTTTKNINGTLTGTVNLSAYPASYTDFQINGTLTGATGGNGINGNVANVAVYVAGAVTGGAGAAPASGAVSGGAGGIGVDLTVLETFTNQSTGIITGGAGGVFASAGTIPTAAGAAGGAGVALGAGATLDNSHDITGGAGGGYTLKGILHVTGAGGTGVFAGGGTVNNFASIQGGAGASGSGGAGVDLQSANAVKNAAGAQITGGAGSGAGAIINGGFLYNGGLITGGAGAAGAVGGDGVRIDVKQNYGLKYYGLETPGTVTGGLGGGTGVNLISGYLYNDGGKITGGAAASGTSGGIGVKVDITHSYAGVTELGVFSDGVISGGAGGGAGVDIAALIGGSVTSFNAITGGAATVGTTGGDGVDIASNIGLQDVLVSNDRVVGGTSGIADFGVGGIGLNVGAGDKNVAAVYGSVSGGAGVSSAQAGSGGAGISLGAGSSLALDATFANVNGGAGGNSTGSNAGGNGGAGIYLASGATAAILVGSVTGGAAGSSTGGAAGKAGDAVQFAATGSGRLMLDAGAQISGQVVASHGDTLELGVVGYTGNPKAGTVANAGTAAAPGTLSDFGTQFTGFGTLEFAPAAAWTVDTTTAGLIGNPTTLEGFTLGDKIDIQNLTPGTGSLTFNPTAETLTVKGTAAGGGAVSLNLNLSSTYSGLTFTLAGDGATGTDLSVACYRVGTRIRTPAGEVPVEHLAIGDHVASASGPARPIRWIGRRRYAAAFAAGNWDVQPIRIRAGALGGGLPVRDLWVSPEHALYLDGMLIAARHLVNGMSIIQEDADEDVSYVHLEFDAHTLIFAEGALAESFVDDDSRQLFDNAAEYARLYPHRDRERGPVRFCAPRIEDGLELEVTRRRLAALAAVTAAPDRIGDAHQEAPCHEAPYYEAAYYEAAYRAYSAVLRQRHAHSSPAA